HERVEVRNYSRSAVDVSIDVALGADFADVFEIRGVHTPNVRGRLRTPVLEFGVLRFSYEGTDGLLRDTVAAFDPPPDSWQIDRGRATLHWQVHLEPKQTVIVNGTLDPAPNGSSHEGPGLEHEAGLVAG